jgi:hypothetical protein
MNKQFANWKLICIASQLSIEQIIYARRFRNWEKYDKLTEGEKLLVQLEEFEIYEDILDPNYVPKFDSDSDYNDDDDEPDYFD